jgi:hypothetical protein
MAQGIADPHLRAELASCDGQAKLLAGYFRSEWPPRLEVLKNLSRHLNGSENWNLSFVVRNGRPPRARSGSLWEDGQESNLANSLLMLVEGIANNSISQSETPGAQKFLAELADALDPNGPGKWKLFFKRPRRGNPSTQLQNTIRKAILGHRALHLYSELKNWRKVDEKLDEAKPDAIDSKSRKAAVKLVRGRAK